MHKRTWKITFKNREVTNPVAKIILALLAIIIAVVIILATIILFIITIPVAFPLHFILRAFGRQGFVNETPTGGIEVSVSSKGFKKASL